MSTQIPYAVSARPDTGMNNARLGLWLFLSSEAMLFGGLISAYAFLRGGTASAEFGQRLSEIPLAGFNTLFLLGSGISITLSVWALRDGAFTRHRTFLSATILLGALFIGLKWIDWSEKFSLGQYPSSSTYLAIFYTLTGVHALHVIGGIAVNVYLWVAGKRSWGTDPDRFLSRMSAASLYWNFVDGIWIILFLLLYVA
jgi:cytochrome c oxidase subunit III